MKEASGFQRICASDAFTTLVVCMAIFSDTFVYDLIIPFMPTLLENRLDLPRDEVQFWTSTLLGVFGVTFALGNVIAGYLTDRSRSKKLPFLFGMITMLASSLMFFLGRHITVAVVARALQGVSASFVWVSGLAFLNSHLKPKNLGMAMGNVSLGMGIGELAGPLVGGVMYEHAGHYAVLGLVCGILGLDILLRFFLVDSPDQGGKQQNDDVDDEERPLLDADSIREPETAISNAPAVPELREINVFGVRLDIDLFSAFYAACVVGTVRYAFESALVIFVTGHFGWSTSASGGILFAFLSPAILGPLVGHFTTKYGPKWISSVCFAITALGLIALGFLTKPDIVTKVLFVIDVTLIGITVSTLITVQSIAFSVATKRMEIKAKRAGERDNTGGAFGGFSLAWTVGMFVGPAAAEVFVDYVNWMALCIFLAAFCSVSAVVMLFTWNEWEVPEEDD